MSPTTAMVKPSSTVVASSSEFNACAERQVGIRLTIKISVKERDLSLFILILIRLFNNMVPCSHHLLQ